MPFDERRYVGHAGGRGQYGHRDFELLAARPQRRHEGAANPVAGGAAAGAEPHTLEALFHEAREVVRRLRAFRIHARNSLEFVRIALETSPARSALSQR